MKTYSKNFSSFANFHNRAKESDDMIFGQEILEKNSRICAKTGEKFEFTIVYSPPIS